MAAGKKLGTVFTELGLDSTEFNKAQQKILVESVNTARKMEENWRQLGSQSDLIFNAQKKNIIDSYNAIVNNAKSSSAEIIRAEEAKTAKIKALNEQQYGSHTNLIDQIKKNYIAMAAAAAVVYAAVIKPIEAYMASETALLKMGMAMKNQGDFTRAGLAGMEEFSKQIQRTTAYEDDATLAVMANLKSFGLSNEQVKLATKAALDLATAKANEGMTIERASEILGKSYLGISTGLKKLGIQVDETASKSELFNSVMQQVEKRFGGSAQAELLTYAGQWKQLKNQWQDVQEFLGLVFLKTMEALKMSAFAFSTAFTTLFAGVAQGVAWIGKGIEGFLRIMGSFSGNTGLIGLAEGMGKINKSLQNFADFEMGAAKGAAKLTVENYNQMTSFDKVSTAIDAMGKAGQRTQAIDEEAAKAAKKALQEREAAEKAIIEIIRKAQIDIDSARQSQYTKDLIRIDSEVEKYRKLGVNETLITQFAESEKTIAKEKARLKWIELNKLNLNDLEDTLVQETLMHQKSADKTKAIWDATYGYDKKKLDEYLANHQQAMQTRMDEITALGDYGNTAEANNARIAAHWMEERAKWILGINKSMAHDIARFTGDEFKLKKDAIEEEYRLRKLRMGDSIVLEKWREIELKKLDEERILRSNDFWAGMRVAYEQDLRAQKAWGQQGAEIWRGVFGKGGILEGTLTGFFTDFFQGHLKTAQDYFKSFTDAVLAMFAKMIAEMVAMWVASKIAGFFGLQMPGGGGVSVGGTATSAGTNAIANQGTSAAGNYFSSLLGGGTATAGTAAVGSMAGTAGAAGGTTGALAAEGGLTTGSIAIGGGATAAGAGTAGAGAGGGGAGAAGAAGIGAAAAYAAIAAAAVVCIWSIGAELASRRDRFWTNPFLTTPDTQSELGYMAITNAVDAPWYSSGNPKLQGLYDIVAKDPWFDPQNLFDFYVKTTGLIPTLDSIKQEGTEWHWFARRPEYQAAVSEALKWQQEHIRTEPGPAEGSIQYNIYHSGIDFVPRTGFAYLERGERVTSAADNTKGGRSQVIHFTWSGNIISTDKSPSQLAKEIVRPLKAELRRLEAMGTA